MTDLSVLSGVRVLVVGLGREGSALAEYLARHGISVAATDRQPEDSLAETAARLRAAGVSLTLGRHPESLLDTADLLFVSPGVPLEVPFLAQARQRGIPLSTESRLFCHLCPAPIVGVTGSSGKTTTTTLVGQMLQAAGRKTWVGGNIGRPLIQVVDDISAEDAVVMELSSFQLEYYHARLNKNAQAAPQLAPLLRNWSPPVAALLNVTPNHLDRHPSMKQYVRAKRSLIDYQTDDNVVVMSLDNDLTRTIGHQLGSRVRWFSLEAQMPLGAGLFRKQLAFFDQNGEPQPILPVSAVKLRGEHNLSNILAACLLAREAGASPEAMQSVTAAFTGVEHRLQQVRVLKQVTYINDSISTSPERLMAALRSFSEPIVLLAGGRDKQLPWDEAARLVTLKARRVILFGEAAPLIEAALRRVHSDPAKLAALVHHCENLDQAVQMAAKMAQPGDVVLLSPGCASFDQFTGYTQRGQQFGQLVNAL